MADMDKAINQLKNMLSTEEGQKQLENIIGSFTGGSSDSSYDSAHSNSYGGAYDSEHSNSYGDAYGGAYNDGFNTYENSFNGADVHGNTASAPGLPAGMSGESGGYSGMNIDSLVKMKSVMDNMKMDDDPRAQLLNSLRPYIRSGRGKHIDNAIRIMSLGNLPSLIKNMRK